MSKHKHKAVRVTGMQDNCFCLGCNDYYKAPKHEMLYFILGVIVVIGIMVLDALWIV